MKEFNIWILFDCPDDKNDKKWLMDGLTKIHSGGVSSVSIKKTLSRLSRQGIRGKLYSQWIMVWQAIKAVRMADENDVIVCWNQRSGLYVNQILKRKNIRLISMNWLTPSGNDYKVKRLRLSLAKNDHAKIVVNSPNSPEKWVEFLGFDCSKKFIVLPDVYDVAVEFVAPGISDQKYCFTGGMNNRDWSLIIELAERHPEIRFTCVALKSDFTQKIKEIPGNVDVYYDLPVTQYYELMKNAYIVLLPLLDTRVAGLINIIKAAQYGVPCMVTRTPATGQYYNADVEDLLVSGGIDEWDKEISKWFGYSEEEYKNKAEKFCDHIKMGFSPQMAVKRIYEAIKG